MMRLPERYCRSSISIYAPGKRMPGIRALPSSVLARMLFVIVTQLIVGTNYVRKGPPVSR